MANKTIVITGASGFVGSNLVEHFASKGWQVRALVRGAKKYQSTSHVRYYDYDLARPFDEAAIFKGADYLVHTAYIKYNRINPDALKVNVEAAKRLLAASRTYNVKKNIFMSTMSAHSEAESVYGKQKLAIEKLFDTDRDIVLRSGLIIGNGGIVKQMASFMKSKHMVPLIGGGKQPLQIIAIYDLMRVIEQALTTDATGIYTVATPSVYDYRQFYRELSASLGIKVLFVPVPLSVLIAAIQLITFLHLPLAVSKDNALGLKKLKVVDTANDLISLGVKLDSLEKTLQNISVLA